MACQLAAICRDRFQIVNLLLDSVGVFARKLLVAPPLRLGFACGWGSELCMGRCEPGRTFPDLARLVSLALSLDRIVILFFRHFQDVRSQQAVEVVVEEVETVGGRR